jgi:hypothetical protein
MNLVKNVILIVLFFLLSPNILFRLPGNKYVSALLHGALFAIVWYVSNPVLEGNTNIKLCDRKIKKYQSLTDANQKASVRKDIENLKCTLPPGFNF